MNKNSITHLFEDVNLYENKEFNFYTQINEKYSKIEDSDLFKLFDYLGLVGDSNLITDCIWCGGHFPFKFSISAFERNNPIYSLKVGIGSNGSNLYIHFETPNYITDNILTSSIETHFITIDYYFSCTNNKDFHNYYMKLAILFSKEKVIVTKIGQFPENSSLGDFVSETYKKELRRIDDSYIDYKNSEKSYKCGLYAGAYDYLRRVYEKMINYYLRKNQITVEKSWGAKEKIKAIKHCFDKGIREYLYPFYNALSVGVHTMPEDECKENYNELKAIIDIQLQFIKSVDELDSQIAKSKNVLEKLNSKYPKS